MGEGSPRVRWYHSLWDDLMNRVFWSRGRKGPELTPRLDMTMLEIEVFTPGYGWSMLTVKIGDTITSAGQVI